MIPREITPKVNIGEEIPFRPRTMLVQILRILDKPVSLRFAKALTSVRALYDVRTNPSEMDSGLRTTLGALQAYGLYNRDGQFLTDAGNVLALAKGDRAQRWAWFWCTLRVNGDLLLAVLRGWDGTIGLNDVMQSIHSLAMQSRSSDAYLRADACSVASVRADLAPLVDLGYVTHKRGAYKLTMRGEQLREHVRIHNANASDLLHAGASLAFLRAELALRHPATGEEILAAFRARPDCLRANFDGSEAPLDAFTAWAQARSLETGTHWIDEKLVTDSRNRVPGGLFCLSAGTMTHSPNVYWRAD